MWKCVDALTYYVQSPKRLSIILLVFIPEERTYMYRYDETKVLTVRMQKRKSVFTAAQLCNLADSKNPAHFSAYK